MTTMLQYNNTVRDNHWLRLLDAFFVSGDDKFLDQIPFLDPAQVIELQREWLGSWMMLYAHRTTSSMRTRKLRTFPCKKASSRLRSVLQGESTLVWMASKKECHSVPKASSLKAISHAEHSRFAAAFF
jgi:hypothetical protein